MPQSKTKTIMKSMIIIQLTTDQLQALIRNSVREVLQERDKKNKSNKTK